MKTIKRWIMRKFYPLEWSLFLFYKINVETHKKKVRLHRKRKKLSMMIKEIDYYYPNFKDLL